jgi:hypothetical protein
VNHYRWHGFKGVALASPKRRLSVGAPRNLEASCSPWTAVKGVHIGPPRRPGRRLGVEVVALGDFGRPGLVEREAQQLSGNPNWSGKRRNWWRELRGKERENRKEPTSHSNSTDWRERSSLLSGAPTPVVERKQSSPSGTPKLERELEKLEWELEGNRDRGQEGTDYSQ